MASPNAQDCPNSLLAVTLSRIRHAGEFRQGVVGVGKLGIRLISVKNYYLTSSGVFNIF